MKMPLLIDLTDKEVIIVGGGKVASRKAQTLSNYSQHIIVISPTINDAIQVLVKQHKVVWKRKQFEVGDVEHADFVVAATNQPEVNRQVQLAIPKHTLFNHASEAESGDVSFPSTFNRDRLSISVSTDGASPKLTKYIIEQLKVLYPSSYAPFIQFLYTSRQIIKCLNMSHEQKQRLLTQITELEYLDIAKQQQFLEWLKTLK
ncbi:NAD(P)-binding protein [Staphylococcus simiae]|uniref:NAD(P)-binding protein n=1 Tax=Staphylococcus simiae TaxID=308354 RepID=UPI001A97414C|nr:NAD(P)-binding protein [Staphylococcus simiae]MBO1199548.1 NAD(P)-binding protein [Staphylococcus simiae]MBO1201801.1 NAD(P)-binding protein [Staphylococcus simiae]MBO1203905.1 NAD(P)-binding protein [Staphylococcus simiae]MBO1211565.1 NAD(P)-binding protein [Staphylococcus simiae]MBO1230104.1 NAD(P)-binding protein [Staphylococcus simiae]